MDFMCGHRGENRLNRWHGSSLVFDTAVSDKCDHKTLIMALVLSCHMSVGWFILEIVEC